MIQEEAQAIEYALDGVPQGTLSVQGWGPAPGGPATFPPGFQARVYGRGLARLLKVFPGVQLCLWLFSGNRVELRHPLLPAGLELTHCHLGRTGWSMGCGGEVYLGPGDLSLHRLDCCGDSAALFPLGYFQGITVLLDLAQLAREGAGLLDPDLHLSVLAQVGASHLSVLPGDPDIACIFQPLYRLGPQPSMILCRLKVQELLARLMALEPGATRVSPYGRQQTQAIREVHDLITHHLDHRFTIEELSRRFLINTSTLKELFKAVYGLPIATYMKQYRVHQAMQLLLDPDVRIADVATRVGYETQGKFTKAFKDVLGQLPSQYRRQHLAPSGPL